MDLADIKTVERLLSSAGFTFKKSLGQNFIIDNTVCPQMAAAACDKNTGVIEIGPGIGVLTVQLSRVAKRVVAIELDERLKPILAKTLNGTDNTEVIFADAMKIDLKALIAQKFPDVDRVVVCANLPYYITSPVIMGLLEAKLPIESIVVMIQKEAAQRLCAKVGSRDAGAVTVAANYYAEGEILFEVSRDCFIPAPKVDSAVIKLKIRSSPAVEVKSEEQFFRLVKACFAQRRKTLINTVSNSLSIEKIRIADALNTLGLSPTARSEELSMEQLATLCDLLF